MRFPMSSLTVIVDILRLSRVPCDSLRDKEDVQRHTSRYEIRIRTDATVMVSLCYPIMAMIHVLGVIVDVLLHTYIAEVIVFNRHHELL